MDAPQDVEEDNVLFVTDSSADSSSQSSEDEVEAPDPQVKLRDELARAKKLGDAGHEAAASWSDLAASQATERAKLEKKHMKQVDKLRAITNTNVQSASPLARSTRPKNELTESSDQQLERPEAIANSGRPHSMSMSRSVQRTTSDPDTPLPTTEVPEPAESDISSGANHTTNRYLSHLTPPATSHSSGRVNARATDEGQARQNQPHPNHNTGGGHPNANYAGQSRLPQYFQHPLYQPNNGGLIANAPLAGHAGPSLPKSFYNPNYGRGILTARPPQLGQANPSNYGGANTSANPAGYVRQPQYAQAYAPGQARLVPHRLPYHGNGMGTNTGGNLVGYRTQTHHGLPYLANSDLGWGGASPRSFNSQGFEPRQPLAEKAIVTVPMNRLAINSQSMGTQSLNRQLDGGQLYSSSHSDSLNAIRSPMGMGQASFGRQHPNNSNSLAVAASPTNVGNNGQGQSPRGVKRGQTGTGTNTPTTTRWDRDGRLYHGTRAANDPEMATAELTTDKGQNESGHSRPNNNTGTTSGLASTGTNIASSTGQLQPTNLNAGVTTQGQINSNAQNQAHTATPRGGSNSNKDDSDQENVSLTISAMKARIERQDAERTPVPDRTAALPSRSFGRSSRERPSKKIASRKHPKSPPKERRPKRLRVEDEEDEEYQEDEEDEGYAEDEEYAEDDEETITVDSSATPTRSSRGNRAASSSTKQGSPVPIGAQATTRATTTRSGVSGSKSRHGGAVDHAFKPAHNMAPAVYSRRRRSGNAPSEEDATPAVDGEIVGDKFDFGTKMLSFSYPGMTRLGKTLIDGTALRLDVAKQIFVPYFGVERRTWVCPGMVLDKRWDGKAYYHLTSARFEMYQKTGERIRILFKSEKVLDEFLQCFKPIFETSLTSLEEIEKLGEVKHFDVPDADSEATMLPPIVDSEEE